VNRPRMRFVRLSPLLAPLVILAGCASATSVESEPGTYTISVAHGAVSSEPVMNNALRDEADKRCPKGWSILSEGPNPDAQWGGRIYRIRCVE
jgi:hypothetical protein